MEPIRTFRLKFSVLLVAVWAMLLTPSLLLAEDLPHSITLDNQSSREVSVKVVGPAYIKVNVPGFKKRTVMVSEGTYHLLFAYKDDRGNYAYSKGKPFDMKKTAKGNSHITIALTFAKDRKDSTQSIARAEWDKNESMMAAVLKGDVDRVKTLLAEGIAEVNYRDKNDITPLMKAAEAGHEKVVKLLLAQGADVNLQNNLEEAFSRWTSKHGNELGLEFLLELGEFKITALMKASGNGHEKVVKLLLDKGADVNLQSKYAETALMKASGNGHEKVVKVLLAKGAEVDQGEGTSDGTALSQAFEEGHEEVVKLLLAKGADANLRDVIGRTILMRALSSEDVNEKMVKVLLAGGADANLRYKDGSTALIKYSDLRNEAVVKLLLAGGAKIDLQNKYGETALMKAASRGEEEIVKLLLASGADVALQNEDGKTACGKARSLRLCRLIHPGGMGFLEYLKSFVNVEYLKSFVR